MNNNTKIRLCPKSNVAASFRCIFIVIIFLISSTTVVSAEDSDGDGYDDSYDSCPTDFGSSSEGGTLGCPDFDGDGWADMDDAFPSEPTQWEDSDGDGYGDNSDGYQPDICPDIAGNNSDEALRGCPPDTDGDGSLDHEDAFPLDGTQWSDVDGDGFGDNPDGNYPDTCPNNPGTSSSLSMMGCSDSDGDGYADPIPQFSIEDGADIEPHNPFVWNGDEDMDGFWYLNDSCPTEFGLESGCPDSDSDGVNDYADLFMYDPLKTGLPYWDDDGDSVSNENDSFPLDATQWSDIDGDGYGDNQEGNSPDGYPADATKWNAQLIWGAKSETLPDYGFSGNRLHHWQDFDLSKESTAQCINEQGIRVCIQFVILIIGEVDAETNLDLQINDNLDGTSDISVNSDFDITDSKLKIKPELRISFKSEQNSVDEDFTLYFPTPNQIYPDQTYSSNLGLYYWDEYLVINDAFNYDDESNRIEIASVDLALIITERWEAAASTTPMGRVVSTILDETFNLRIPLSVGFYVDTTTEYDTISIGVLDGASNIQSDEQCLDGCTATVNNNNTTSSLSVYTFAEGTVAVDIGGYLTIGIEIDMKEPLCAMNAFFWGIDDSNCWYPNKYTEYYNVAQMSFIQGSSSATFEGLRNTYTFALNGCTDSDALNQNVDAAYNDSSCTYPKSETGLNPLGDSSSSLILYAGAGIGFLLFAILIVFLYSRQSNSESGQVMSEFNDDSIGSAPPSVPPASQINPDSKLQGNFAEDGYEWIEYPPGQGEWYWRDQSSGEWVHHQN